ncbi:MAG: hypothetical protein CMM25_03625 [Rhodospirillaceae bacterium]|nr:hypothetical protein [Rhodospirillaceae bacterium]
MNSQTESFRRGATWEKSGTTSWVQCFNCEDWFHIGPSLLDRPEIKLHCPYCHNEFFQNESKRLITAG